MLVEGTKMSMIRGDTEFITITCKDEDGNPIALEYGDTVYFTVKLNTGTEQKVLQKVITTFDDGNAVVELEPADTSSLPYKSYKYDIQWTTSDGKVRTIIAPSLFTIEPEVTFESV